MTRLTFAHLVSIYRVMRLELGTGRATLTILDQGVCDAVRIALEDDNVEEAGLVGSFVATEAVAIGNEITLSVQEPRRGLGVFVRSVSALLAVPGAKLRAPTRYFVYDLRYAAGDLPEPSIIVRYGIVREIADIVSEAAVYVDREREIITIIDKEPIPIPVIYTTDDLTAPTSDDVRALRDFVTGDIHREQKHQILCGAIVSVVKSIKTENRFTAIVSQIAEIRRLAADGYRLFASAFSYEKIKGELQAAKLDYSSKIHKLVSEVQNQILTIPVATVVVVTQMKSTQSHDIAFWTNTGLAVGSLMFTTIMFFLFGNQSHTLCVLEEDIERQQVTIRERHRDLEADIATVFDGLAQRLRVQRRILMVMRGIVVCGFLGACAAYLLLLPTTSLVRLWIARQLGF